ncbi:MAG: ABC transporter permease [Symbiobacterium thermophilum]|uniref:ABC transporter permease n=1 Tax=Symbiobacterium thermophilum TaxID=2734 RepID=A0A953IFG9_SYMTR|nr:ABC transporter permease [Symbiobacterium thermophilum]
MAIPTLLILALLGTAWVIPLLWTFATAFRPPGQSVAVGAMISADWTLENFARAWSYAPFGRYYLNTVILVSGILILQLVTTTLAAYAFARLEFPGRNLIFLIFLLQLMVPAEALAVPNYITMRRLNLIDTHLAMMLPYVASAFGTFLLRQTFRQVPRELEEAAAMDGCGPLRTLWHAFIPLARPTLVAYGLVSVSYHWNNFFWPMVVTNTPETRPLTVGLALFAKAVEGGSDWALVTAGTVIVILPLLVLFLIFQRQFISSFMHSGFK